MEALDERNFTKVFTCLPPDYSDMANKKFINVSIKR